MYCMSEARIALDVGEERVHQNPHLPHTRSEWLCPGSTAAGCCALPFKVRKNAPSANDITTLLTMAEHFAVAINKRT
jgi:hypothetical protein